MIIFHVMVSSRFLLSIQSQIFKIDEMVTFYSSIKVHAVFYSSGTLMLIFSRDKKS